MSARANKSLSVRRRLAASPLALLLAFPIRIRAALRHLLIETSNLVHWLYASRETTNFNYDISDLNRLHLAWWIADIAKVPVGDILDYFAEVEGDLSLRQHIRRATLASPYWRISDANAAFGRRLGWYALVRAVKPLHVVETGIDKGLGTVLLSSALLKNGNGRITAIDTAPGSGWMVSGEYAANVAVVIGDSSETITKLERIDLLIHDVHYTPEQEWEEYRAVLPKLTSNAFIFSDNAHSTNVLPLLAAELNWSFTYFREEPVKHFYRGGGMAVAMPVLSV